MKFDTNIGLFTPKNYNHIQITNTENTQNLCVNKHFSRKMTKKNLI